MVIRAFFAAVLFGALLSSCTVQHPDGVFACSFDRQCPAGFSCVGDRCSRTAPDAGPDARADVPGDVIADTAPNRDVPGPPEDAGVDGMDAGPAVCTDFAFSLDASGSSSLSDVVVDVEGNAYVAGHFQGELSIGGNNFSSEGFDMLVVKLGRDGRVIWASTSGGPADDRLLALHVQTSDEGANIIVVGTSEFEEGDQVAQSAVLSAEDQGPAFVTHPFGARDSVTSFTDVTITDSGRVLAVGFQVSVEDGDESLLVELDGSSTTLLRSIPDGQSHGIDSVEDLVFMVGWDRATAAPTRDGYIRRITELTPDATSDTVGHINSGEAIEAELYTVSAGAASVFVGGGSVEGSLVFGRFRTDTVDGSERTIILPSTPTATNPEGARALALSPLDDGLVAAGFFGQMDNTGRFGESPRKRPFWGNLDGDLAFSDLQQAMPVAATGANEANGVARSPVCDRTLMAGRTEGTFVIQDGPVVMATGVDGFVTAHETESER